MFKINDMIKDVRWSREWSLEITDIDNQHYIGTLFYDEQISAPGMRFDKDLKYVLFKNRSKTHLPDFL